MTENKNVLLMARVRALIESATAGLDSADRAQRIAYCREHDQHGVRMHISDDDGVLEFRWGGRTLAMVRAADLDSEMPLRAEFVADDMPDTVPDEWTDQ